MNQDVKENQVIKAIDNIFQKGHKSKFSESFQKSVSKEAQVICEYLGINSENQAICFGILFGMSIQKNSSIDFDDLSSYLNTSVLRVFLLQNTFDELIKKKLLQKPKPSRRRRNNESLNYLNLYVPSDLVYAVVNGEPLPKRRKSDLNIYEILDIVFSLFQQRDDEFIDTDELCSEIEGLINENKKLPFIRQILNYKLPIFEHVILLFVCQQFVEGYQSVDLVRLSRTLLNDIQKQINFRKEFINRKTKLQQEGVELVDLESDSSFRSDKSIVLTEKGQSLFGEDRKLFIEQDVPKNRNIILSSSITEKRLFFNEREQKSLDKLTDLLRVDNHIAMVNRMKDLGYNTGLTILFHGAPGTGKTEMASQLGKSTGNERDILKVDISETKSKWWGESEKRVKGIFDFYRKLLSTYKVVPILLFNEMDGVFGKRMDSGSSSTDSTSNAIQTVLLNEMEQFPINGILIATTNLPKNLDKSFERRFLYKICFDIPDSHTRSLIWREKLPILLDLQIDYLSNKFLFSGGQIDNVVKKTRIEILLGRTLELGLVEEFCQEETLDNPVEKRKIGYLG
jgi:broad-specificity NMP kinase